MGSIYQPASGVKIVMSPALTVVLGLFAVGALGYLRLGWIARWWVGKTGGLAPVRMGETESPPDGRAMPRTIRRRTASPSGSRGRAHSRPVDPLPTDPSRAA